MSRLQGYMRKTTCLFRRKDGSIMAIALAMLVFLTLLGMAATTISEREIRIAANDKIFKHNFYLAEGATMTGAQRIEDERDNDKLKSREFAWLHGGLADSDILSAENWEEERTEKVPYPPDEKDADETNRYFVVDRGAAHGSSMHMSTSETSLHELTVYGRSAKAKRESIVELGYRKRF